jgi:predicted TIM-barrel fold metal-dependent hydrolase
VIDVSCFVGTGPLTDPRLSEPDTVATLLRREGVTRAGVSPMAGLFRADPAGNADLPVTPFFRPVPIVDPRWPDIAARLDRCRGFGIHAVRISPGSHGYPATAAVELRKLCWSLGLTLVLQMRVADPRNLPPDLVLGEVAAADAITLARAAPSAPMIVAGARAPELAAVLAASSDAVLADLSLAEEPDVLRRAVTAHGAHRLLTGTHTPFLTPAAARQKLVAANLDPADHDLVSRRNAERLGF